MPPPVAWGRYGSAGASLIVRPGPPSPAPVDGREWRSDRLPAGAPAAAQAASVLSSIAVSRRRSRPRSGTESRPGIQGGIAPAFVIRTMPLAFALASASVVKENGAIPPIRWQVVHFVSRIGATSR